MGAGDWVGMGDWKDHAQVRARLDAGADPESWSGGRPLHRAAAFGSPEVVAELAARVADVDALERGVSALWEAVEYGRVEHARVLVAAGADPWLPQLAGWSPGRLALAGPTPDLFELPAGQAGLTDAERLLAEEAARLRAALGKFCSDGMSVACVTGVDADEAVRRLDASDADAEVLEDVREAPDDFELDEVLPFVGVTSVPGGCVLVQPWGYAASTPVVLKLLTPGTRAYGVYANPKSGNQGSTARDGVIEGWDLHPGGGPDTGQTPEDVLRGYLYSCRPMAYACAWAGLAPADARAFVGEPDRWVRLPERDYWGEG
ncbi:ankyrin repeat domain-containing protein [Streptomyces roseirectus]|uniref:Ankyrin repeat domain-containing protein n=1 Tax=Streptomyces roseirectus TaxID=2768066 RepID=A0A7H0IP82_9ACTN|nr:ankyrin repeat domain-containing protein [Streptomyces roseirectus]QNP74598.1 ankyrin repeat domain-containing protein [Streptomyces roseirectus]